MRKIEELGWAAGVAAVVAVLGFGLGWLWYVIAPPLPVRKVEGGYTYTEPDPEQPIAGDGWFAILAMAFGILLTLVVWAILRKARGPLQLTGLVLGALAAGVIAIKLGESLEKAKYDAAMKAAAIEQVVDSPAKITVVKRFHGWPYAGIVYLPALGSALSYAVLAGWSRWPGLRPEPEEDDDEEFSSSMAWDPADPETPEPPVPRAEEPSPGSGTSARTEDGSPDQPR